VPYNQGTIIQSVSHSLVDSACESVGVVMVGVGVNSSIMTAAVAAIIFEFDIL
jgi:hypothetical protein